MFQKFVRVLLELCPHTAEIWDLCSNDVGNYHVCSGTQKWIVRFLTQTQISNLFTTTMSMALVAQISLTNSMDRNETFSANFEEKGCLKQRNKKLHRLNI